MRKIGEASDPVKAFVRARCAERAGSEEKAADLHRAFQAWAEDHNQLSSKAFGSRLAELGYSREKRGGVVRYSGLSSPATSATGGQILVGVAANNTACCTARSTAGVRVVIDLDSGFGSCCFDLAQLCGHGRR